MQGHWSTAAAFVAAARLALERLRADYDRSSRHARFSSLHLEYLASLPDRLDELRSEVACGGQDAEALRRSRTDFTGWPAPAALSVLPKSAPLLVKGSAGWQPTRRVREPDELEMILNRLTEAAAEAQAADLRDPSLRSG